MTGDILGICFPDGAGIVGNLFLKRILQQIYLREKRGEGTIKAKVQGEIRDGNSCKASGV